MATTLSHPASSSHRGLTEADRAALGLSEGFFRVSVGLEDPDTLTAIFTDAVAAATRMNCARGKPWISGAWKWLSPIICCAYMRR